MHLIHVYREKLGWGIDELSVHSKLSPRLIWTIDTTPEYDFKKSTMVKLCDAFNLPPSVLFFPEQEFEKRQMLSAIMRLCMDLTGLSEKEFLLMLYEITSGKDGRFTPPKAPQTGGALPQDEIAPSPPPSPAQKSTA